ncbi:MAG: SDR family NAD(P)-dependent oxidoreductase [Roseburia sp.]|nr:SDR family NAD(P)-dependent oxidoreductase [Roseburia sp.]MCM1099516.1 SDR family NAD(P)-dependent oxidoreductase [Ruminococcus flavefaciens]
MNIILITGASSGIGREFAFQLDPYFKNIDEFWLIARRESGLKKTAECLRHKFRVIPMDITDPNSLDALEDQLIEQNAVVRMLVNCAGFGLMGAFSEQPTESAMAMIRLNCEALTEMTHRMIPYMRKNSRIIQLASSAAFLPQPDFAVYAATKAYVLSFSRALNEELRPLRIAVTSVCPGPVDTPFFEIAEQTGSTLKLKKYVMAFAEQVVEQAIRDSYYRRSMSVYSLPIKAFHVLAKAVPHDVLLGAMGLLKKKGF